MDCFAEPAITVRAQLRLSQGAHSCDPLARNDGKVHSPTSLAK